ncbi:MAG: Ig-like domain-containing protein, partial [Chloroflexota bacterium]
NVDSNMATQTPSQEQAIPFQTINSSSGALIAGQSISYTVMMDNEGESLFLTSWIGDNVSAVLIRPDGQRITPEYAITQPTVSYEHIEGGPAYPPSASYYFTQTLPGLWHVILEHDGSSAEAIAYTSYVAAPSSLQLNVTQPLNTYQIDETVTLTATLVLGGIPVQDGVVTATVIRPDGVEVELTLEARGNGLYQTDYRLPDMPGYSIVEVTARGVTNGIEYTRQSDVLWTVAPRDAQFTENVSDQAIDFDNDSLMDALLVGVEIQVSEPATYVVSAQIAHNTVIIDSTSLNIPIHISGTYSVPLVFDGQYIHDVQLDGPYTIVNAVIRAEQFGTIAIDQIDLLHTTEAYQNFTKPVPPPDDNTNTSQPHIIHVNITPITITANSTSTAIITATVTDAANTPLIDQTISFTTTLGTISPLTATTNSSGVVTTTLTVDNQPGIATITAYADAITATTSVTFTVVETPTVPVIPVPPAPISLTDVRLIAATHGVPDIDYTFTAIGVPFNATPPVTYTWQATDQPDVVQAGGIVNAVTWSWATMGVKEITVVAQNALAVVTQTHTITIQEQVWTHLTAPTSVMIEGDSVGAVDVSYPFTATIAPADATPPLFYVWHTSENLPVIQMRHITSTVNFTWTTPGVKEIHLSAANLLGTVTDTYTMTIQENPVAAVALSVDNLMLMANGDNRSTIVATVMDEANDTPRAAQMVTFTTSLGAVTPAVAETDAAGRVTTTLTSGNKAGVAIVEAHVDKVMASTPVVIAPVQNTGNDNETDADADAGADTGTDATPTDTAGMMTTLTIDGPDNGQLSHSYAFTVSVGPPDVMLPVTYLWEATGQRPQITWGGVEAFATWSWSSTGSKTITVTTVNEHNMLTQTYMIDIQKPVELPEQTLTTNRLYLPVVHRETLVGAASLRREGHHLYLPIINR